MEIEELKDQLRKCSEENTRLHDEVFKTEQLADAYEKLMAYWKARCFEADQHIDTVLEIVKGG